MKIPIRTDNKQDKSTILFVNKHNELVGAIINIKIEDNKCGTCGASTKSKATRNGQIVCERCK